MNNASSVQQLSQCPVCGAHSFISNGTFIAGCNCMPMPTAPSFDKSNSPFAALRQGMDEPIEIIKELVALECCDENNDIVSFGKPYFAKAITYLDKMSICKIKEKKGYNIKAEWL